jgi:hypothetical protein
LNVSRTSSIGPALGAAVLSILAWTIIGRGLNAESGGVLLTLLDGANLIFHEAGHMLFLPFGEFLHYLGGSLTQVVIPALCAVHFLRQQQIASAYVAAFWTGQSLTNVAIYVADAKSMDLPLIGGDHDWNYLLARLGLLNQAEISGRVIFICGVVLILLAIIGLGREFIQRWRGSTV